MKRWCFVAVSAERLECDDLLLRRQTDLTVDNVPLLSSAGVVLVVAIIYVGSRQRPLTSDSYRLTRND